MTTRDRILQTSLELFAKKGFDGVSVREIAKHVGVRESALYKHFKNKEEILQQVIEEMKQRSLDTFISNQVPEKVTHDITKGYRDLGTEEITQIAWSLFQFYTKDVIASNFRKLLSREQYENPMISALYNQFFLEGVIKNEAQVFSLLVENKYFREEDSNIIALQFYGPILLLFQEYDCNPQNEEKIKEKLFLHVEAFGKNYKL